VNGEWSFRALAFPSQNCDKETVKKCCVAHAGLQIWRHYHYPSEKKIMKRFFLTTAALLIIAFGLAGNANAQLFWNTNGANNTWTAANWGPSAAGPFTTAWTNNSDANFTANSLITFVTNTQVGNVTVANGVTVTMTAVGTYSTMGNVRTLDVGTGSILDYASQSISTVAGTGFIKNGAGIYFSANGNQFPGGFTLNAGTVIMGGINAMGGGGGALNINGGTIAANNTRTVTTRYSGINIGGNFTMGAVTTGVPTANGSPTANITFADNVALGAVDRTITIGSNGTYTFSGIMSGAAGTGLTVVAAGGATGSLGLGGASTYDGGTTVNSGTLFLSNTTGSATGTGGVAVNSGGRLLGGINAGTTAFTNVGANRVDINSGAILSPGSTGTGGGTMHITGTQTAASGGYTSTVNVKTGATFHVNLTGTTTFSQVSLTGTMDVTGSTLDVHVTFAPIIGSTFLIVNNDGTDAITGTFAQGTTVTGDNGQDFMITYNAGDGNDILLTTLTAAPTFVLGSAASVKTHGAAGDFPIALPLSAPFGIECRSSAGNHTLVFTFNNDVASGDATVTTGTGTAGTPTFATNTMTVPLTGVTNIQLLTVTLENVTDTSANVLADTPVSVKFLIGDTTNNSTVNAGDVGQTKGQSGNTTVLANFRNDTNVSGSINAGDVGQVKANSGNSLPP
jgi:hypothetical protein